MDELARHSEGFSGADIEGVVKDAVETAFVNGHKQMTTDDVLNAMRATHPLSEIMKDSLDKMQKEYDKRGFKNASKK